MGEWTPFGSFSGGGLELEARSGRLWREQAKWAAVLAAALINYLWEGHDITGGGLKEEWDLSGLQLSMDASVPLILETCESLKGFKGFEIGDTGSWGDFLYSFSYQQSVHPVSGAEPESTEPAQIRRSPTRLTITSYCLDWESAPDSGACFDFDTFLTYLYLPGLQEIRVDRLVKEEVCTTSLLALPKRLVNNRVDADGGFGELSEPGGPQQSLQQEQSRMLAPVTQIMKLELNETRVRPAILGAILERTPLLTHLTYDFWISWFGSQVEPFCLPSLRLALQGVKETLKYLNLSATRFYDEDHHFHHHRASSWVAGQLGSLIDLKELRMLVVKPWEMICDETTTRMPLADLLPPNLQMLEVKAGEGGMIGEHHAAPPHPPSRRIDDFLSFIANFTAVSPHSMPVLKEIRIDVHELKGAWLPHHAEAVRRINEGALFGCQIIGDCELSSKDN